MSIFGLRKKIKGVIKDLLHLNPEESQSDVSSSVTPSYEPPVQESTPKDSEEQSTPVEEPPLEKEEIQAEPTQAPEEQHPPPDVVQGQPATQEGRELTTEAVQEVLDDDVRPALQMDGGDIELIKVEDNNIYVKLVGACSTCPSSVMTMKMGVENLLKEEFPSLNEIIEVQDPVEPVEA